MNAFKKASFVCGIVGLLQCCLLVGNSLGAMSFVASFDGTDGSTDFGPNLTLPGSPGNYQIQSNQAANPGVNFATDANRIFVRTVDADYATKDFVAEITMTRTAFDGVNYGASGVFGIGEGVPDTGSYYTPDGSIFLETFPVWGPLTRFSGNAPGSGGLVDGAFGSSTAMPDATTSRFRIEKTGNNLQFKVDVGSSTFTTADITSNLIDLTSIPGIDLNSDPSYLFFGGGQNITWDNFTVSVVPEPSSLAMLLCGGAALVGLIRRKRK